MKIFKSKIALIIALILIFGGFIFSSEIVYFSELIGTVYKIQRTEADITDYKYFDNIEITKSSNPQKWPIHKNYNKVPETEKLKNLHEEFGTVAFLIIKNDSIWHEKYFSNYNKNSHSNSFSMAKSIVSATMGKAIEKGFFKSMNDKVGDYINGYNNGLASDLTIGDLASMSSGMDWNESYTNIFGVTARSYITSELNELIKSRKIIEPSGKSFKYYSSNTQLLSMTIEKATGRKISDLVKEWFTDPLGFENNVFWQIDGKKNNSVKAYCCFNSNARDFARFGKLYKDFGKWKGNQILDSTFVLKSIKPRFKESSEYGYGFWLGEINKDIFFAMRGILGQYVIVIPEKNIIIVRLGERNNEKDNNRPKDFDVYFKESLKMLENSN
ncbi:beta-lactamase family protein [Flavobacteriaceae bacterium]|nr:beta-lactamase family protein [Flavobacteriaceae bacterium]